MYNVLIIEDDRDIIELLSLYLSGDANFTVYSLTNGSKVIEEIENKKIDVILLDVMMPEINGYEVIKLIRSKYNIPIIMISANIMDSDHILALNLGADAYINKPFNPLEVIATINAIMRRNNSNNSINNSNIIKIDNLELDTTKFILKKDNRVVPLTSYEYKILHQMMTHPNQIFTKSQLYECINDESYESYDNTMMVHISKLRSKIEDNPSEPKYIKTIRGLGYKFANE